MRLRSPSPLPADAVASLAALADEHGLSAVLASLAVMARAEGQRRGKAGPVCVTAATAIESAASTVVHVEPQCMYVRGAEKLGALDGLIAAAEGLRQCWVPGEAWASAARELGLDVDSGVRDFYAAAWVNARLTHDDDRRAEWCMADGILRALLSPTGAIVVLRWNGGQRPQRLVGATWDGARIWLPLAASTVDHHGLDELAAQLRREAATSCP